MATVLHISSNGNVYWRRTPTGWEIVEDDTAGPVWVVTDLQEETFVEVTVPRVFGGDRSRFLYRQMVARFPDSVYRVALPARGTGSLMDRLAPPKQTLFAIDPAGRLKESISQLSAPVAGVWGASLLMVSLAQSPRLPSDLFVVLYTPEGMRIMFLRNRTPVLTRLLPEAKDPAEQVTEIVRTLRHLENIRVLERNEQRFGVLLLGAAQGLVEALALERLDAVPLPAPWSKKPVDDWRHILFDLALKSPKPQLAPLELRATFVAKQIKRTLRWATVLAVAGAAWFVMGHMRSMWADQQERGAMQAALAQSTEQVGTIDEKTKQLGISPALLRAALKVDEEEIGNAPDLRADMVRLSSVISTVPDARLKALEWKLLAASEVPCAGATATAPNPAPPEAAPEAAAPQRKLELSFNVLLPDDLSPRQRAQRTEEVSRALANISGATVLNDPAKRLKSADLRGGGMVSEADRELLWCMTLPGVQQVPAKTASLAGGIKP